MPWEGALYRRDKLYEQVWLEPLRSVARQYGISDVERQRRDAAELEHEAATRQRAVFALVDRDPQRRMRGLASRAGHTWPARRA